jgi:hypothetical protein
MTNELPPLPEIPTGDRFKDVEKFRLLGHGQGARLFECWEEAVHTYAREYARAAALAEREACARVCEEVLWPDSKQWAQDFAAAIRARSET